MMYVSDVCSTLLDLKFGKGYHTHNEVSNAALISFGAEVVARFEFLNAMQQSLFRPSVECCQ